MSVLSSARRTARAVRSAAVVAVAALFVAGCDLTTVANRPTLDVSFFQQEQQPPVIQPPTVTAEGGFRFITVRGSFIAQCTDVRRAANYTTSGNVITIRLIFTPLNAGCASQDPYGVNYTLNLVGLDAGTYEVRMVHEGDQGVPTGTEVLRQSVTVTNPQAG